MSSIVAVGLDLVDLDRFGRLLARHGDAFTRRFCRDGEARRVEEPGRAAHFAGLFAAKEAAMKALGTGWGEGIGFLQIEVVRQGGRGRPTLRFHERALERFRELGCERAHVSITHDRVAAAAVVVLEGRMAAEMAS